MIYLDNHATTPCDQRVVDAMVPWLSLMFGNPHSTSHSTGRTAAEVVERSAEQVAELLSCPAESVVWTSGATESNNLAIRGICDHPRQKRRHIVTCQAEHHAVLDVAAEFETKGWSVTNVPVYPQGHDWAGSVDMERLAEAIGDDTALVSIMWANNEIGSISPMRRIADLCHQSGALLHSDATQAVGRIPVNMLDADIDLLSATAHKFYGPKGTGLLIAGNGNRRVRLKPQIIGGGQQRNLRGGTVSPALVVALTTALHLAVTEQALCATQSAKLRQELWNTLSSKIEGIALNGISLESENRLSGNLSIMMPDVEGQAWMAAADTVGFSSGSACSSVEAKPSHVLTALGLDESQARRTVRFGIGKMNTESEIGLAAERLIAAYDSIRP